MQPARAGSARRPQGLAGVEPCPNPDPDGKRAPPRGARLQGAAAAAQAGAGPPSEPGPRCSPLGPAMEPAHAQGLPGLAQAPAAAPGLAPVCGPARGRPAGLSGEGSRAPELLPGAEAEAWALSCPAEAGAAGMAARPTPSAAAASPAPAAGGRAPRPAAASAPGEGAQQAPPAAGPARAVEQATACLQAPAAGGRVVLESGGPRLLPALYDSDCSDGDPDEGDPNEGDPDEGDPACGDAAAAWLDAALASAAGAQPGGVEQGSARDGLRGPGSPASAHAAGARGSPLAGRARISAHSPLLSPAPPASPERDAGIGTPGRGRPLNLTHAASGSPAALPEPWLPQPACAPAGEAAAGFAVDMAAWPACGSPPRDAWGLSSPGGSAGWDNWGPADMPGADSSPRAALVRASLLSMACMHAQQGRCADVGQPSPKETLTRPHLSRPRTPVHELHVRHNDFHACGIRQCPERTAMRGPSHAARSACPDLRAAATSWLQATGWTHGLPERAGAGAWHAPGTP